MADVPTREEVLESLRGAPPPQGSAGGDAHDCARPDRDALELYAEANDLPEYGGVVNPRYLEAVARNRDGLTFRSEPNEIARLPGGGV